jgi:hypothetical protein
MAATSGGNNFTIASTSTALPSHVRNRSGGTGGSTPTTINFNLGSTGATSTPPTHINNNQRQNSLGFDNTASFLGTGTSDPNFNAASFEGRTVSGGADQSLFGSGNGALGATLGRSNSSNLEYDDENEPPLLEELGIRPDHIIKKVMLVLNPVSRVTESHEICMDEDLAGPLTFVVCLGMLLTLQGKVHFGAIYGCSVVGILLSYFLLSMMSRSEPVRTTLVVSTLGYCLLPDLILAIFVTLHMMFIGGGSVGVFLPVFSMISCAWSSWCAMKIFAEAFKLHHVRFLILYPAFLFYAVFAVITMF